MPSADFAEMLVGIGAKRIGARAWIACCPAHDDHSPSLTIYEGSDMLPVFVCGRCEWRDVRDALRARGLMKGTLAKRRRSAGVTAPPPNTACNTPAPDYTKAAMRLWSEAYSASGTMVERYLRLRGLGGVLDKDLLTGVLRFHPRCPRGRGKDVVYRPAMIALMRDIVTDRPVSVHRTFLTDDCRKDGKPMMLGPSLTGAIKLCPGADASAMDGVAGVPRLCICEGIETGLAAMLRGYCPMWALGSAGAMERFPVLFWIDQLTVCADHDVAGERAGINCMGRWAAAGVHAGFLMPPKLGTDWADYVGVALS